MPDRPDYKSHPLWREAMAWTREAYDVADVLKHESPEAASRLRKAAVSVPAHVASALAAEPEKRAEHMVCARGALARVSRELAAARVEGGEALLSRCESMDRAVLFEFGAAQAVS